MNAKDPSQARFNLIREMSETVDLVRRFDPHQADETADRLAQVGRLLLTGEGSSRIFPAKNAIRKSLAWGLDLQVATEGARQAALYDLRKFAVFAASNSGRTSEVVSLLKQLQAAGHLDVRKAFIDRKPKTFVHLTPTGRAAYEQYVLELRRIIGA